jgi:hypothetical protein
MTIGSVLLQPHKVAAPLAPAPAALVEDLLALATRLLWDRAHGGACLTLTEKAFAASLERLLAATRTRQGAAAQKLKAWAQPLVDKIAAMGQSLPGDSVAHETILSGDRLVSLLVELLDGITTDALAQHANFALSVLQNDLGLTNSFVDQQVGLIIDDIVAQLRGAPLEADLRVRENRFEIIVLVRRIRRDIDGLFELPPLNVDRFAALLLSKLRELQYDAVVGRAAVTGKALKSGLDVLGAISDEVTFSAGFSGGPGAAAAPGASTRRCWYASWVTGEEVNDVDPLNCSALQPFSFLHLSRDQMEKATLHATWVTTLLDGFLVALIGYLKGRGVYSITTVSMMRDTIYTVLAPLGDINLPTALDPWLKVPGSFDKLFNLVSAALCSFEGRSLNDYDGFLYLLRLIFRFGGSSLPLPLVRDAILSIMTLSNHDPEATPKPENRNNDGLIQFVMQILGPLLHAGVMPDNFFSINGEYGSLIAAVLLGALGISVVSFFFGFLLSIGLAGDLPDGDNAAGSWAKGYGLSHLSFIGFWFLFNDGRTNDGKRGYKTDNARGTEVEFKGYPGAATSPYLMPFEGAAECIQGNHGFWSHNSVIGQVFSYDFSLNLGQDVLCMREGEVFGTPLDSVDDGEHPDDGNHIIIKHTTPNADHDLDVNGTPTTTYAKYYHGQKGTIAAAFGGSIPAAGTPVTQGQLLFKCNSTGMSRCNHIHVQVNPDNGSGAPNNYTMPWVFKDIDGGVAKSATFYDSQNVKKP